MYVLFKIYKTELLYIPKKYQTSISYNISQCAQDKAMKAAYPEMLEKTHYYPSLAIICTWKIVICHTNKRR